MKTVKRLLCAALVACLLVAALVPAAFASESQTSNTLTYAFGHNDAMGLSSNHISNNPFINTADGTVIDNKVAGTNASKFLLTSRAGAGAYWTASYFAIKFKQNATYQHWYALQISDVKAGTYDMVFTAGRTSDGGLFKIHVLNLNETGFRGKIPSAAYTDLMNGDGELSASQNEAIFNAVNASVLNPDTTVVFDSSSKTSESATKSIGYVTFPADGSYVLLIQSMGFSSATGASTSKCYAGLVSLTMTPVVEAKIGDTSYATVGAAIAAAKTGDEIDLQADVQTGEIVLPEGVVLDLNGKALTATMDATQGILTDSSNGGGKIANSAVFDEVGSNEVALVDGEYFRIFDYELEEVETVKNSDTVHFWFDVTLSNDAYALIAKEDNDSKFNVGATLQWNDNTPQTLSYDGNLNVKDWAAKMQTADYSFYVKVTGLSSAAEAGTLKVMPTVSGKVGGGSLAEAMTCSVEAAQ